MSTNSLIIRTLVSFMGEGKPISRLHGHLQRDFSGHSTPTVFPWETTPSQELGADLAGPTYTCYVLLMSGFVFMFMFGSLQPPFSHFFAHRACPGTERVYYPRVVSRKGQSWEKAPGCGKSS